MKSLSLQAKMFLLGTFITNVGNGLYVLGVSKHLFDLTGSVLPFGMILLSEFLFKLVLQGGSGYCADRYGPVKMFLFSDFSRFSLFLISAIFLQYQSVFVAVVISTFAVNFFKPFYIASAYSFSISVNEPSLLTRYNSLFLALKQGGMMVGMLLAGFIMSKAELIYIFSLDALSYFLVFLLMLSLRKKMPVENKQDTSFNLENGFRYLAASRDLLKEASLRKQLLTCCIDPIVLYAVSLLLVPITDQWHGGDAISLAILQAGFVLGVILNGLDILKIRYFSATVLFLGEVLILLLIPSLQTMMWHTSLIFFLGYLNSVSFSFHYSALQQATPKHCKGMFAGLYLMVVSSLLTLYTLLATWLNRFSVDLPIYFTGAAVLVVMLIGFLFTSKKSKA